MSDVRRLAVNSSSPRVYHDAIYKYTCNVIAGRLDGAVVASVIGHYHDWTHLQGDGKRKESSLRNIAFVVGFHPALRKANFQEALNEALSIFSHFSLKLAPKVSWKKSAPSIAIAVWPGTSGGMDVCGWRSEGGNL